MSVIVRLVGAAILGALLPACSGSFRRQADFEAYAKRIGLEQMSIGAAIRVIQQKGYTCSNQLGTSQPLEVRCEKSFDTGLQIITLSPSPDDPAKCVAAWEQLILL